MTLISCPEILSKTATTISVQFPSIRNVERYKLAYSQYGYLFYSWEQVETSFQSLTIKDLEPATCYVCKCAVKYRDSSEWSEYSELTPYFRTFTEEEAVKRSGTYYEHALRLERQQTSKMQSQIKKLSRMLHHDGDIELEKSRVLNKHADLVSTRSEKDAMISKLQEELQANANTLVSMQEQKATHERLINDLIREGEELKQRDGEVASVELNQKQLQEYQTKHAQDVAQIQHYRTSLADTRQEIATKEEEVEKIMQDCRRLVQEHADTAHAKQLQLEDALQEAKEALEQQVNTNELLRNELARLGPEYQQANATIERLSAENARLR